MIVFDVETGPLPVEQLARTLPPFDELAAVPDPGEFDESTVKVGGLGTEKSLAKIDDARRAHEAKRASLPQLRAAAREAFVTKHVEKAALDARTGQVLAIGWLFDNSDCDVIVYQAPNGCTESDVIKNFWSQWNEFSAATFLGHNILGFDLPFLVRRSWLLGIDIPRGVQQPGGRYFSPQFVDTMVVWGCGSREFVKLEDLDRALGELGKPLDANGQPVNGGDFARLFNGTPEERELALEYLREDLRMTRRVAEAMQLL